MLQRALTTEFQYSLKKFPVIALTGPRQSGKTTLARTSLPQHTYISLDQPDMRTFALDDPRAFLKQYNDGVILDEVQRVPELFSYIQSIVDESGKMGQFVLTGSQNFLMSEKISQSLSGRVRTLRLLPFSLSELKDSPYAPADIFQHLFTGGYPPIYDRNVAPAIWQQSYIETYLERDVRHIKNITDLGLFQKFMQLCAARIGQLLNLNSLATDCGISFNTARDWISVLDASYIAFTLQPYHENFGKRVVKQPKLYFYDTGLVAALLHLENAEQLRTNYLRGALFENLIISEYLKYRFNSGKSNNSYFWRDNHGIEIDIIIDTGKLSPVEIKSGETWHPDFLKGINKFTQIAGDRATHPTIVFAGDQYQERTAATLCGWQHLEKWLKR